MVNAVALLVISLAASFLCPAYPWTADDIIFDLCPKDSKYSSSDPYKPNLDALVENLMSMSSRIRFTEHTEGTGTNKAYGQYLCPDDLSLSNCSTCVLVSFAAMFDRCPNNTNAKIWSDNCILQYSNVSFFGALKLDYTTWCDFDHSIQDARFDKLLSSTLTHIADKAAAEEQIPGSKFATMEADLAFLNGSSRTLYTRAQCMPDLSQEDCSTCLTKGITVQLPQFCLNQLPNGTTIFGRTASSSCILRYDTKRFYNDDELPAPAQVPTPAAQVPTPALHPLLPPPPPPLPEAVGEGKNIRMILVIVGICMSVVMLLAAGMLWRFLRNRTDKNDFEGINMEEITTAESLQMDFSKVRAATLNFAPDRKLGEGGFGDVYMGKLENGQEIAVKRLTRSNSGQGIAEFKNEVVLVAKLQHRNLVKLLGFCLTTKEKILVYEYLPNSSLDKLLFDPIKRASFDWEKRLNIISGIAKGLLYLLEDSRLRIIHRDLKSSNILLDEDMNPKISDFGIAKTLELDKTRASTEILAGTYGYMAPEYLLTGQYSLKSDIYSFGIIVLEMVTGQRNFHGRPLVEESLLHRAWRLWNENAELEMVDPELKDAYSPEEVVKCIHIGLLCIQENAGRRPRMGSVVAALSGESVDLPAPTPPNFFDISRSIDIISGSSSATTNTTSTNSGTHLLCSPTS